MDELATAIHESGHAVAIAAAFRDAEYLPRPEMPIRSIEIRLNDGVWLGQTSGLNIYSPSWPKALRTDRRVVDLMKAQATIHLAGPLAEAVHRGEKRRLHVLEYARQCCALTADMAKAEGVINDLVALNALDTQALVDQTLATLWANWGAVEALARALIEERRIEGGRIGEIIG